MYKMVDISVAKCADVKVHTITVANRELFWVKMHDVHKNLGVKNMYDLVRKNINGIFETKSLTKEQIRKYKIREKELGNNSNSNARSDRILKIIMHCRTIEKAF